MEQEQFLAAAPENEKYLLTLVSDYDSSTTKCWYLETHSKRLVLADPRNGTDHYFSKQGDKWIFVQTLYSILM